MSNNYRRGSREWGSPGAQGESQSAAGVPSEGLGRGNEFNLLYTLCLGQDADDTTVA